MEKRLYNATKNGDKNELICGYPETPLHVAAMLGHYDFTDELLIQMPKLAKELDSRRRSPLHLAVGKGHRKIVIRLLEVNPDMCFICDIDGRNPLHIAAMKGRLAVLRELLEAGPWAALSPMAQGDTILHACVRWNQLEALKLLLTEGIWDEEFAIDFLIRQEDVNKNIKNKDGLKPFELLSQNQRDEFAKDESLSDTIRSNILVSTREPDQPNAISEAKRSNVDWLKGKGHNLILVASLLADMAFHAAVNPPGGFWHDNDPSHRAGHSIFADTYPNTYTQFLMSNTFGFMASLIIIQLLISGLPIRRKLFKQVLIAVMSVAIVAMGFAYAVSLVPLTSDPAYP
ncbi:ankyrin repeat-containing protein ITN1-like [Gossypium arboreum]|uniref:ankyrin repeat-containing protein ITN1-like n=1 Tax=Gossypium arboreum TaxID=29729 RepID=UPI0022F1BA95|nr:ankyrin repeat-containing protein ITN1-like [Gossypium arboreum]